MTTAERVCDDIDVLLNQLVDEYVDGEQLRRAVKALQLARDLVEAIPERDGDEDTRLRDDRKARFRELCPIPEGLFKQMEQWK